MPSLRTPTAQLVVTATLLVASGAFVLHRRHVARAATGPGDGDGAAVGRTACEMGPPLRDDRASWEQLRAAPRDADERAYAGASLADLAHAADAELVSEASLRLFDKVVRVGVVGLSRAEQNVLFVTSLDAEVERGGYDQYFDEAPGNCAARAAAALGEMGMASVLAIHQRALAVFPGGAPAEDRRARGAQMQRVEQEFKAWDTFDHAFYELGDRSGEVARYIRANLAAFELPPAR